MKKYKVMVCVDGEWIYVVGDRELSHLRLPKLFMCKASAEKVARTFNEAIVVEHTDVYG